MITVSFGMIFRSVLFSALTGVIFGFMHSMLLWVFRLSSNIFYRKSKCIKCLSYKSGFLRHLIEFVLVIVACLVYILSGYVFLDGAYEMYSLSALVLTSIVFNRLFSSIFNTRR